MTFRPTTTTYQPGARTLDGHYYTSQAALADERARLFPNSWLCVGREADIPAGGDYVVANVAGESLIIVRDRADTIRAFHNVCRHRGTRICTATNGQFGETIQCPYHAWTYRLDGRLTGAPHMAEADGFDMADYPLHQAPLGRWDGFLFVNLGARPGDFERFIAPLHERFARYNLATLRSVRRIDYEVAANWKLILQNYSECLHCPTIHPELSTKLPFTSGANDLTEGAFLGGYMEIKAPNESATMTGRSCGLPLGTLSAEDRTRAYYYTLFPAMMLSVHMDYAVYYTVDPVAPDKSRVRCEWMVNPDSPSAPNYNIADAEEFWDRTNRQDWAICEQSQLGVSSRVYAPGPYSPRESIPAAWDREYLRAMAK
ncbi:MAG: aromatic ring-hydroxylating dioxygenase subunit alpha [Gemmatimonadetes bacterium]|nr:aromatic ring-hydroxylating dioxygenase subunit alpha [Gemmatimonadota bacterium]